jgi:hypothetical protein
MTADQKPAGALLVVSLDGVKPSVAQVQSVLASFDIPVELVESGRRLRWSSAVVLRIPEQRMAEAMLALGMNGFPDVMAYQSGELAP